MTYLEECIRKRLTKVGNKIDKGRGIWAQPGYIKDDDWAHLHGEYYALYHVLYDAGLEV